jgi:hypothetical protein
VGRPRTVRYVWGCLHETVVTSELLTTVGLLYLRLGENYKAFEYLGNSLTHDPKNPKVGPQNSLLVNVHSPL